MSMKAFHRSSGSTGLRGGDRNSRPYIMASVLAHPAANAVQKPPWHLLQDAKKSFAVVQAKLEAGAVSGMVSAKMLRPRTSCSLLSKAKGPELSF